MSPLSNQPNGSVLVSNAHDVLNLADTLGHEWGEVLDVDARVGAFLQLQPMLVVLGEQVSYLLLHKAKSVFHKKYHLPNSK